MGSPAEAFVYDAIRTPRGRVKREGGTLAGVPSYELFAQLLRAFSDRGVPAAAVEDVVVGVSTTFGEQASDPARVAVMQAGWPDTISAGVVSRMCCSGLDALASGAAQVRAGQADLIVAGGMESMSRVPMFSDRPAFATDPELGATTGFVTIGVSADLTAAKYGITRSELDAFAVRSHELSLAAPRWESLIPIRIDGEIVLAADEGARAGTTLESLGALKPLFSDDPLWSRVEERFPGFERPSVGLHTVGTAPQLCDAASAAVIGSARAEATLGRRPIGRIVSWAHTAVRSPGLDGTVAAAGKALDRANLGIKDVKVAEFNESFAVSPLVLIKELGLSDEIVNIRGGAVSVGHPLGASGGILLANALELLRRHGGGHGLLVIPGALGVATAVVVESPA
ncbi:thiolase family protein [Actinocorallia libanotica]|uniref:Acetyl-CoA C-acetyltransferase n=1 Tax=Actinocorallia libanotica TaxID=46162 RepID=A0ABN1RCU3_9ACTN